MTDLHAALAADRNIARPLRDLLAPCPLPPHERAKHGAVFVPEDYPVPYDEHGNFQWPVPKSVCDDCDGDDCDHGDCPDDEEAANEAAEDRAELEAEWRADRMRDVMRNA